MEEKRQNIFKSSCQKEYLDPRAMKRMVYALHKILLQSLNKGVVMGQT
jgi:hypothetical protein